MKELTLVEFEDEVARGCDDHKKEGHVQALRGPCGTGYCKAWEGHECRSIPMVRKWLAEPGVVGVVLFRNQDMWASQCGASSCVVVGQGRTYETIEACEGKHLNDLPSQRQYAECFVRAKGVA